MQKGLDENHLFISISMEDLQQQNISHGQKPSIYLIDLHDFMIHLDLCVKSILLRLEKKLYHCIRKKNIKIKTGYYVRLAWFLFLEILFKTIIPNNKVDLSYFCPFFSIFFGIQSGRFWRGLRHCFARR